ncbi:hypothetical protein [Rhodanobacter glycinis]|jgi:hypothetical protein|uniref:hypothetical protein n=1 Tax=Rhodanobacter glycinis TaxID=582702 RepID=UPI001113BA74|nr:hypothetical protein [Rhodanobacter glycinis]
MNAKDACAKSTIKGRHDLWIGLASVALGLLVLFGAWREITHHDGLLLVIAPAAVMPLLASLLARRSARKNGP